MFTHDFKITAASVNEIISGVADASTGEYNKLLERIRKSQKVYVRKIFTKFWNPKRMNETSFPSTREEMVVVGFPHRYRHSLCSLTKNPITNP